MTTYTAASQSGAGTLYYLESHDSIVVPAGVVLVATEAGKAAVTGNFPASLTIAGEVNGPGYFYAGQVTSAAGGTVFTVAPTGVLNASSEIFGASLTGAYAPYFTLINQGRISGQFYGGLEGLAITNSGTFDTGLTFSLGKQGYHSITGSIENSGLITSAASDGINLQFPIGEPAVLSIQNSATGRISSTSLVHFGIFLQGYSAQAISIDNAGIISDGLSTSGVNLSITNSSSISGNISADGYLNVVNYAAMFTGFVGHGALDLTNLGSIYGDVGPAIANTAQPTLGALHVDNSGTIYGSIIEAAQTGDVLIKSTGTVTGSLSTGSGNDYADFRGGTIAGPIILGEGDNVFLGGLGQVRLTTGSGRDVLHAGSGDSFIDAGGGNDTLIGGDSRDTLYGGPGNDVIAGRLSDNIMAGGIGNDTITGGSGNDFIVGDDGNDVLSGAGGYNAFAYQSGFGHDMIADFNTVGYGDHIWFQADTFDDFAAVKAAAQQVGGDVVITLDAADSITMIGTMLSSLTADYFIFGG